VTGPSQKRGQVWSTAQVADGLLGLLGDRDRERLLSVSGRRTFARNEVVCHEGEPGETLYIVRSGRLAVRVTSQAGAVATLAILSPGRSFGELALLQDHHTRTATVVALEPAETVTLSRAAFEDARRSYPEVEHFVTRLLAERVEQLSQSLLEAMYLGVDERLARRLVELAEIYGPGRPRVVVPITQDDLAGMTGTTRPTANLVLGKLADAGIVRLARGRIEILDLAGLRRQGGLLG
jgi:CRP/FNR family cyclic AMP-dependent transcriptional regulator